MIDLSEIERRARAEVLATCLAKVEKFISGCQRVAWDKRPLTADEIKEYWVGVRKQFQQLQPAAADLKKLLWKEREKFRVVLHRCTNAIQTAIWNDDGLDGEEGQDVLVLIQKARATLDEDN